MIIDADVHISPTREGGNSIFIEQLIDMMDDAQVDQALTWLQPPMMREIGAANKYVYDACRRFPDRILGFGWADPTLGVNKAKDEARKCIEEYGFYGVKLNGAQNGFFIDDPHVSLPVVEEIAKLGKILALHIGADAFEETHPFRAGKIAKLYPELTILLVHMGGVAFRDISMAAIEIAADNPNITLIGSSVRPRPVLRAINALGSERVCFGSDTPFEIMKVELAKYKAMLENRSKVEIADIMGGNIARLFKLDI
ncbi:MAG TPA: amidohydrolase family protein [Clostridia bacterium]|nr:amidohydrolase family protein [Clostridia bacterium]